MNRRRFSAIFGVFPSVFPRDLFGAPVVFGRSVGVRFVDPPDPSVAPSGGPGMPPPAAPVPPAVAAAPGTPPAEPPAVAAPTAADRQLREAISQRKKLRFIFRWIAERLGYDPDELKIVATRDPSEPYAIEGADDISDRLEAGRLSAESNAPVNPAAAAARRNRPVTADAARLTAQVANVTRQRDALIAFVKRTAVIDPIRATCIRMGAIDDDNGQFSDIVNQLLPRFTPEVEFDPENMAAEPIVSIVASDASGSPAVDPQTGVSLTPAQVTEQFLRARPKYLQTTYRGGPGAGGAAIGGAHRGANGAVRTQVAPGAQPNVGAEATTNALSQYFGIRPETIRQRVGQ